MTAAFSFSNNHVDECGVGHPFHTVDDTGRRPAQGDAGLSRYVIELKALRFELFEGHRLVILGLMMNDGAVQSDDVRQTTFPRDKETVIKLRASRLPAGAPGPPAMARDSVHAASSVAQNNAKGRSQSGGVDLVSIHLIQYNFNMKNKYSILDQPALLKDAGLRLTRQRQALAALLFDGRHKHVTAEQLHAAAVKHRVPISLATVYNTLHQFTDAGLLRKVVIGQDCVYFDTNTAAHHHFFDEESGHLTDVPASAVSIDLLLPPPAGRKVTQVDVTIRVSAVDKKDT